MNDEPQMSDAKHTDGRSGLSERLDLLIAELAELNKTLRAMTKWDSCGLPALPMDAKP